MAGRQPGHWLCQLDRLLSKKPFLIRGFRVSLQSDLNPILTTDCPLGTERNGKPHLLLLQSFRGKHDGLQRLPFLVRAIHDRGMKLENIDHPDGSTLPSEFDRLGRRTSKRAESDNKQ